MVSDACIFVLKDGQQVVGVIGVRVDDFLLAGQDGNPVFDKVRSDLEQSYLWGRWDEGFHSPSLAARSPRKARGSGSDNSTMWKTRWMRSS